MNAGAVGAEDRTEHILTLGEPKVQKPCKVNPHFLHVFFEKII
jgi:hypothetical protein